MNKGKNITNKKRGFTLIEILVVIGIIALLATIVIVAVNPAKQFAQARNSQRTSNVNAILNAIGQRMADNKGKFDGQFSIGAGTPVTYICPILPTTSTEISTTSPASATTVSGDLGCLVPTYIAQIPMDPNDTVATSGIKYFVIQDSGTKQITVCAPDASGETAIPDPAPICVTR